MESVGAAASVAGLLSLTLQLSQMLYDQVHLLKNAPKEASQLLDELGALSQVLTSLQKFLASQLSNGRLFEETSVLVNAIKGCKDQVNNIKLRLEKITGAKSVPRMLERGKWFYERAEYQELMQTLNRYLTMFQMSLTVDGLDMLSRSIADAAQEARQKAQQLNDISQLLSPLASMSQALSNVTDIVQHLKTDRLGKFLCSSHWSLLMIS